MHVYRIGMSDVFVGDFPTDLAIIIPQLITVKGLFCQLIQVKYKNKFCSRKQSSRDYNTNYKHVHTSSY